MKRINHIVLGALAAAAMALAPALALAAWPEKQVTVVVPFSAGGNTDIVARYIAEKLAADTGQSFIVDNKPGADGNIGAALVRNSGPTGTRSCSRRTVSSST